MKTKEEIEQLAEEWFNNAILLKGRFYSNSKELRKGYENGYTQCQEDMAEKYTEEDMIKFANQYSSINILHLKEHLKEFTLNKQD
jgi:hypothetical protein